MKNGDASSGITAVDKIFSGKSFANSEILRVLYSGWSNNERIFKKLNYINNITLDTTSLLGDFSPYFFVYAAPDSTASLKFVALASYSYDTSPRKSSFSTVINSDLLHECVLNPDLPKVKGWKIDLPRLHYFFNNLFQIFFLFFGWRIYNNHGSAIVQEKYNLNGLCKINKLTSFSPVLILAKSKNENCFFIFFPSTFKFKSSVICIYEKAYIYRKIIYQFTFAVFAAEGNIEFSKSFGGIVSPMTP